MKRDRLTFEGACNRECGLRFVNCGGPTASGLDGYACENCLEHLVSETETSDGSVSERCSYCGKNPAYKSTDQYWVCRSCALRALAAARDWYKWKKDRKSVV